MRYGWFCMGVWRCGECRCHDMQWTGVLFDWAKISKRMWGNLKVDLDSANYAKDNIQTSSIVHSTLSFTFISKSRFQTVSFIARSPFLEIFAPLTFAFWQCVIQGEQLKSDNLKNHSKLSCKRGPIGSTPLLVQM